MIIYYFILLIFTINTALASNLDRSNDIVNPLDSLADTQPAHCMSDSDTELDEDDDMQDNSYNGRQNEKRLLDLDKAEANPQPQKKAKIYKFNCPYANCNFMSDHSINIKKHIRIHTGERPYSCNHQGCTYAAAQQKDLAAHINTIHQPAKEKAAESIANDIAKAKKKSMEKPFKCDYEGCNYASGQLAHLKRHTLIHTGEKPFKCSYKGCNFTAAYKHSIKLHLSVHTGKKPHKCLYEDCPFAATTANTLKIHQRIHTGEKPYKCPYPGCNYAARQWGGLKTHKRIHTGEKPFKCEVEGCEYTTSDPSSFSKHKKKHKNKSNSAVINLLINAGKNKTN